MAKDLLSAAQVKNAQPGEKPVKLADGGGLYLLVQPTGAKLWRFKFRINGKEGLYAVGKYPDMSLADARKAHGAAAELAAQGINPAHHRQDAKQQNIREGEARKREVAGAFAKVAQNWLAAGQAEWAPGTYRAKRARVDRFLLPTLAALPVAKIGPDDIRPILVQCRDAGAWSAVHVKGDLSAIFDYAIAEELADSNPIPGLRALVRMPKSESKAVLTLTQVREFFTRLRAYRGYPETVACLRLIALTACRPGEAANTEWSEFDREACLWRRPAEKMKARRDHVSPLSDQVLALLDYLRPISGGGRYLFPHRSRDTHADPARLAYAMRDLNLGKGASPHCWRTTFSAWANENGFAPDAIERQLAHVESNRVRATYNKALLVEERRKIMQAWADYLSAAESDNIMALWRTA